MSIILDRAGTYARTSLACRCHRCRLVDTLIASPTRLPRPITPITRIMWAIRFM